jgi:hypothetical protein
MNFEVRLEPDLGVEVKVHVFDAEVTGDPGAIDDEGHGDLVEFFEARGAFEGVPLLGFHKRKEFTGKMRV